MNFDWLKRYMPRGIYGRAALILVLPVVTLQLVVSVVFIQRHFEGVTAQMTQSLVRELNFVLNEVETAGPLSEALMATAPLTEGLGLTLTEVSADAQVSLRRWFDFSGIVITRMLQEDVPGVTAVQLPDDRVVRVVIKTETSGLQINFDRRRVSASNPHQLLVNMVFFGGLMTVIAYIYLRNQLRPITRLASAAEAFGRGRKEPFVPSGASEIRAAGGAFLDMRARIERQIEQRTLMLSGVSHDLRTPLTRLRLGLSFLDEDTRGPLERDVDDMQRMLDEFLAFSRDAAEGESETTELGAFVSQIVAVAAEHGAATRYMTADIHADVSIRPLAIRRAVENLINNATRYATRSEVSLILTEKTAIIRVEDDGPGIPADQREEALKPFARLDAARNQNAGSGVGLGLSITADAARAHGGLLRLEDSARLGGLQADLIIAR